MRSMLRQERHDAHQPMTHHGGRSESRWKFGAGRARNPVGHLKASRRVQSAIHDGRAWLEPLHGGGACGSITTNRRTSVDGTALSKEFRILDAVEA
ncbi:MAG: hypothetical protein ACK56F_20190, partial [bacterium]